MYFSLKCRLLFNLFYCFCMFVIKHFTYLKCAYIKERKLYWYLWIIIESNWGPYKYVGQRGWRSFAVAMKHFSPYIDAKWNSFWNFLMAHKTFFISSFPYSLTLVFKKLKGSEHKIFKNCRIKRRTKNWPRTSRTQERLNHCMLLAIYKEILTN